MKRQCVLSEKKDNFAAKLCDKYVGLYKIKRRFTPVVYILITDEGKYAGKEHICITQALRPGPTASDQCLRKY